MYANGGYAGGVFEIMNQLTREETVWLQAYIAHSRDPELQIKQLVIYADAVLGCFKDRFPTLPTENNIEKVNQEFYDVKTGDKCLLKDGNIGVFVTREMLAKAWFNQLNELSREDFNNFCKELGIE